MFLLTANSQANHREGEWLGFVQSVKNFVLVENSALLANITEMLKSNEQPLTKEYNAETM